MTMDDNELLRYARHILLDGIGIEGQEKLRASHVLLVGCGGLGSAAALYLGAAGVGRITLVDHDLVDLTNLQRQIAHTDARVGRPKVESAATAMAALNPRITIAAEQRRAEAAWLDEMLPSADLALDCTDNFTTRQLLNAACIRHSRPLVSGAALGFDGQLAAYDSRLPACACYACVFPPADEVVEQDCATMGVFGPLVGMVGTAQAALALQLLLGHGPELSGILRMVDARNMEWTSMKLARDPRCPVCGVADRG